MDLNFSLEDKYGWNERDFNIHNIYTHIYIKEYKC